MDQISISNTLSADDCHQVLTSIDLMWLHYLREQYPCG